MLDDLIRRQDAINALWKALFDYEDKTEKQFQESDDLDVGDWIQHRIFVQNMSDIDRQTILNLPSAEQKTKCIAKIQIDGDELQEIVDRAIVRCKDCKHWRQQTNYQGAPLSFGFCESTSMWKSLYGEVYEVDHIDTDDNFFCGYAERRADG